MQRELFNRFWLATDHPKVFVGAATGFLPCQSQTDEAEKLVPLTSQMVPGEKYRMSSATQPSVHKRKEQN